MPTRTLLLGFLFLLLTGCGLRLPDGVAETQVLTPKVDGRIATTQPAYYLTETPKRAYVEAFTFLEVLEDSRCPKGVNCIRAGEARVRIRLADGQEATLTIPAGSEKQLPTFTSAAGRVRVLGLEPYPSADQKRPGDGRYELVVRLEPAAGR